MMSLEDFARKQNCASATITHPGVNRNLPWPVELPRLLAVGIRGNHVITFENGAVWIGEFAHYDPHPDPRERAKIQILHFRARLEKLVADFEAARTAALRDVGSRSDGVHGGKVADLRAIKHRIETIQSALPHLERAAGIPTVEEKQRHRDEYEKQHREEEQHRAEHATARAAEIASISFTNQP